MRGLTRSLDIVEFYGFSKQRTLGGREEQIAPFHEIIATYARPLKLFTSENSFDTNNINNSTQ